MSNESLNYFIKNKNILSDNNSFKMYYNFSGNSYYETGNSSIIVKTFTGNASGELLFFTRNLESNSFGASGTYKNFTLSQIERNRYVTKNGQLNILGNRISESGIEGHSYIKILNTQNLFTGSKFTFLFEGGKIPRDELLNDSNYYSGYNRQLPVNDREIIFSNLSGQSGWEIGLNSANLIYFKKYDNSNYKTSTYSTSFPMGENIWIVRYENKNIYLSKYNEELDNISTQVFSCLTNLNKSNNWYIGSGIQNNTNSFDKSISDGSTASIKIKNILYFDEFIESSKMPFLVSGIKSEIYTGSYIEESGINYQSIITSGGYYQTTGILYYQNVLSGYNTTTIQVSGPDIITPLSGNITTYQQNISNCNISGLFFTELITGSPIYGITGYLVTPTQSGYNIYTEVYLNSGITGIISSGYSNITETLSGQYYEITGALNTFQLSKQNLFPRSVSYLGERNYEDFIEIKTGQNLQICNENAIVFPSQYVDGYTARLINITEDFQKLKIFLNGQALRYEDSQEIEIEKNNQIIQSFNINKDFTIGNSSEIVFSGVLINNQQLINNLNIIYEVLNENNNYSEFLITGKNQYQSGYLTGLIQSNSEFYLNGVKLYSGIDYSITGNNFYPFQHIQQITGLYFSQKSDYKNIFYTGDNIYDIYLSGNFYLNKKIPSFWINGLRKSNTEYIYHDNYVDLISGVYLKENELDGLYSVSMEKI